MLFLVKINYRIKFNNKMKQLIYILTIILFIGCISSEDKAKINGATQFIAGMEKFNTNKELMDNGFNLFEQGNLEAMFATLSEDFIWNNADADSLTKSDYVEAMKGWHSEFENFKFTEREYFPGVDDSLYLPNGSVRVYGVWNYNHKATKMNLTTKYYGAVSYTHLTLPTMLWV